MQARAYRLGKLTTGVLVAAGFSGASTSALALPTYFTPLSAAYPGTTCGTCHVNPAGGGPRTAYGMTFEAVPTHAANPAGAIAQIGPPPGFGTTTTSNGGTTTTSSTTTSTAPASGGAGLYNTYCAGCHAGTAAGAAGRNIFGARTCSIQGAIYGTYVFPGGVPAMQFLQGLLSQSQIQQISEYLNSGPVTGQQRYITACAGCHGMDARGGRVDESVRGEDASEIREYIWEESAMRFLSCLPSSDINAIGNYLTGRNGGMYPPSNGGWYHGGNGYPYYHGNGGSQRYNKHNRNGGGYGYRGGRGGDDD